MNNILDVNNVTVRYDNTIAIKNVTFSVSKGDFLGIIGPNGGGKSTLLKAILGLLPVTEGSITFNHKPLNKTDIKIGYVPQFASMNRQFPISVIDGVMTAALNNGFHPFRRYTIKEKDEAMAQLKIMEIENLANRQISDLSGGEMQRMLIARALTAHPDLLLLDEPTASVDAVSREKIYSVLKDVNKTATIILVTHDMMAISSEIQSLACINCELVYHGKPELNEHTVHQLYGCPVELIAHGLPHRVLKEHENGEANYD